MMGWACAQRGGAWGHRESTWGVGHGGGMGTQGVMQGWDMRTQGVRYGTQ